MTQAYVSLGGYDLHISHAVDAEIDGEFEAFCHDEQETITINGWLIDSYDEVEA